MAFSNRLARHALIATFAAGLMASAASADTLRDALVSAYRTNPTLNAQRETLKVSDAQVAVARAAGRPQVSATVGINRDLTRSGILAVGSKGPTVSGGVDLSLPLFNGGSVRNSIAAAKSRDEAGRATLRAVEGDVFVLATSAYMDVIRDRAIVELNQNNVKVLSTNLEATGDRFEIGDLTRTDVAQSEARLQEGNSRLSSAIGNRTSSEASYRQVIGHAPDELVPPPPLPPLPTSADEAVRIALANNPDLLAISRQAVAAGYDVSVARAGRLPTLAGVVSGTYVNALGGSNGSISSQGTQTTAGLNARIPIFQGGSTGARIRAAQASEGTILEQVVGTERAVVAAARSAYASYEAAKNAIQSNSVAVKANELALEGTRAEQSVGTRTILDVLNAEQELLNAQVALVTAKRNAYVAGFQLLNAMGQAEARDLGLDGGPLYDPLGNYRLVSGSWNDWASDQRHVPVSTRTVDPDELPPVPLVTPDLVPQVVAVEPATSPGVTQPPQ